MWSNTGQYKPQWSYVSNIFLQQGTRKFAVRKHYEQKKYYAISYGDFG